MTSESKLVGSLPPKGMQSEGRYTCYLKSSLATRLYYMFYFFKYQCMPAPILQRDLWPTVGHLVYTSKTSYCEHLRVVNTSYLNKLSLLTEKRPLRCVQICSHRSLRFDCSFIRPSEASNSCIQCDWHKSGVFELGSPGPNETFFF